MRLYWLTYLLTYLVTHSLQQNPSWEANRSSASQEILRILWSPKVYYCIYKYSEPVPILIQINPVNGPHPTSCRSILILSSNLHLVFPSGLFPSGFPYKTLYTPLLSPYVLHANPSYSSWLVRPNNIRWAVQIITLLLMWSSPIPYDLIFLRPKYSPQHPTLKHPQPTILLFPFLHVAYSNHNLLKILLPSAYVSLSMWTTKFQTHTK